MDARLHNPIDLRGQESLELVGIVAEDIAGDDLSLTRAIGQAAVQVGREGILAPSAAGPGHVVTVFPGRLGPKSSIVARGSEQLALTTQ